MARAIADRRLVEMPREGAERTVAELIGARRAQRNRYARTEKERCRDVRSARSEFSPNRPLLLGLLLNHRLTDRGTVGVNRAARFHATVATECHEKGAVRSRSSA